MNPIDELLLLLGERFGVLAECSISTLTLATKHIDTALGDVFLLPCVRDDGADRVFVFRATQHAVPHESDGFEKASKKLNLSDSYLAANWDDVARIELRGVFLGYAEWSAAFGEWQFRRPYRIPQVLADVYRVEAGKKIPTALALILRSQLGADGLYLGDLLAGGQGLADVPVSLPVAALVQHIGIFGHNGNERSLLLRRLSQSILIHNQRACQGRCNHEPILNWPP